MSNQEEHGLMQEDSDADEVSEQNDEYSDEVMQSTWHKHFVIIPPGFLVKHFFFLFISICQTPFPKRQRLSALEELFEAEDRALKSSTAAEKTHSIPERVQQEIQLYRNLPAVPTSEDDLAWWWERRDTLPLLSKLSNSYLCIQASSTSHERVFSTAGDTISQERLHILPDQADMQIFLQKNC